MPPSERSGNMQAFFLDSHSSRLFITLYSTPDIANGHWVLHFPAFADEMNKSRHLVSRFARSLSGKGSSVVVCDLYGTGDSEGDFSDSNWKSWLSDMQFLVQLILEQGASSITFWGVRCGCLLALDLLNTLDQEEKKRVDHLLLWQPVLEGKTYLTQFLRLRVAASLGAKNTQRVSEMIDQLGCGHSLEVAGYTLSPAMYAQLEKISLTNHIPGMQVQVSWIEITGLSSNRLSPASIALIEKWTGGGVTIHSRALKGIPFWNALEPTEIPELIDTSLGMTGDAIKQETDLSDNINKGVVKGPVHADIQEIPVVFACQGDRLSGIIHPASVPCELGVVIVVGGPQYRVGSHRQFVLLARDLARNGIPVLRFDYRGMGGSSGTIRGYETISDDIRTAIDCFQVMQPQIQEVVIWGLCDAATAAVNYSVNDARVKGLALLNPWVYSEQGEAKVYLKKYYTRRLLSRDFWTKVIYGKLELGKSLRSLVNVIGRLTANNGSQKYAEDRQFSSLAKQMEETLSQFQGHVLIILSGKDLVAAEFEQSMSGSRQYNNMLAQERFKVERIKEADHTFSRKCWRDLVSDITRKWIKSW